MKKKSVSVGIIKEIDRLGRIVIPKEMRARLRLCDTVELAFFEEGILIRNPEYKLVKISPPDKAHAADESTV